MGATVSSSPEPRSPTPLPINPVSSRRLEPRFATTTGAELLDDTHDRYSSQEMAVARQLLADADARSATRPTPTSRWINSWPTSASCGPRRSGTCVKTSSAGSPCSRPSPMPAMRPTNRDGAPRAAYPLLAAWTTTRRHDQPPAVRSVRRAFPRLACGRRPPARRCCRLRRCRRDRDAPPSRGRVRARGRDRGDGAGRRSLQRTCRLVVRSRTAAPGSLSGRDLLVTQHRRARPSARRRPVFRTGRR